MKKYFYFVLVMFMTLFFSCKFDLGKNSDKKNEEPLVSFENFSTRSVSVKNNTAEKLVAFKGTIELSTLISGVPAHASNHGLKLDPSLFSETGDFALQFITEETFNKNKDNLQAVQNSPFASIYAFYNKSGTNDQVYTISSKSGGRLKFTLHNNSAFNVEIRLNSPEGEVLGYVGAYTANTVLNVEAGDYVLYPVFKKYIAREKEIYSVVPKFTLSKKPFYRDFAITDSSTVWNVGELWKPSELNLSSGGFYLTINNQAHTAVRFTKGDEEFETSLGVKGIKSGSQVMFFVPFHKNPDGSYPDSFKMSTLKIGSALNPIILPEYEYKLDTKYSVTIKGSQADNLTAEPVKHEGKVNINNLFGV